MYPYINSDDLLRYYLEIKKTCYADPVYKGSKIGVDSFKTSDIKNEVSTMKMPEITNYTYIAHIGLTTVEWSDGTKTTVRAENPARADQYTGFVTAYAKKAAGNTNNINNLFDEWAIERPKREAKRGAEELAARLEAHEKQERENKKREKRLIRREALRLKREYEAKKLAQEKYGVPVDEL